MISICVPAYNSVEYLELLYNGLKKNTTIDYELIIHDNGSTDDTLSFLKAENINHTRSDTNLGFCGVNHALKKAKMPYVMMFNADMYPTQDWDMELFKAIRSYGRSGVENFTLSCCLLEPVAGNPEYDYCPAGETAITFDEKSLRYYLRTYRAQWFSRPDTIQYSHPILMPTKMMEKIGYMDEDYFPGWASDHDIAARAYHRAGCRDFKMLAKSRVYHFSSTTMKQLSAEIRARHCEDLFEKKWNQSVSDFRKMLRISSPI